MPELFLKHYNRNHDPKTGRFTSGSSVSGSNIGFDKYFNDETIKNNKKVFESKRPYSRSKIICDLDYKINKDQINKINETERKFTIGMNFEESNESYLKNPIHKIFNEFKKEDIKKYKKEDDVSYDYAFNGIIYEPQKNEYSLEWWEEHFSSKIGLNDYTNFTYVYDLKTDKLKRKINKWNTHPDEIKHSDELKHYGVKGQKKGKRRYQNPDGSLTALGHARYENIRKELEKTYPGWEELKTMNDKELSMVYDGLIKRNDKMDQKIAEYYPNLDIKSLSYEKKRSLYKNIQNSEKDLKHYNHYHDELGRFSESSGLSNHTQHRLTNEILNKFKSQNSNLRHLKLDKNTNGYLYTKDGKVSGVINVENKKDGKWIQGLEVFGDNKGKGLSYDLLDVATKDLNATKLSVRKTNTTAKHAYDKYGFKVFDEDDYMYYMKINDNEELKHSIDNGLSMIASILGEEDHLEHYNHNHDKLGRFASASGGNNNNISAKGTYKPTKTEKDTDAGLENWHNLMNEYLDEKGYPKNSIVIEAAKDTYRSFKSLREAMSEEDYINGALYGDFDQGDSIYYFLNKKTGRDGWDVAREAYEDYNNKEYYDRLKLKTKKEKDKFDRNLEKRRENDRHRDFAKVYAY